MSVAGTNGGMDVRRNDERSRYELVDGDEVVAIADFDDRGDVVVFPHTEVRPELRGNGLGERLVRGALDDVRRRGASIVPACWFVADFVRANPEFEDLLAA
jgi:predicted GNAT family acetyltransferase